MKEKKEKYSITELFLVMADKKRTYTGVISRKGIICHGNVIVEEGNMVSMATTEEVLAQNLDDMCRMKLDHDLHKHVGKHVRIMGRKQFLN